MDSEKNHGEPALKPIRNRIVRHETIRAGDLVPHEMNARTHPSNQLEVMRALYDEIGFARSLLAYELPDGRLKLIDGHARRSLEPDMMVDVEVVDLNDDEAKLLLASFDAVGSLATVDSKKLDALLDELTINSPALQEMLDDLANESGTAAEPVGDQSDALKTTFNILIECEDEDEQTALLEMLAKRGVTCRSLIS